MVMSVRSKWAAGKARKRRLQPLPFLAVEGASRTIFILAGENQIGRSVKIMRDVTDEQRSRRPIFNATLRAGASWLFFRVARSTVMMQIAALYRQSGSDRLEKQPTDLRQYTCYLGDRTLVHLSLIHISEPTRPY